MKKNSMKQNIKDISAIKSNEQAKSMTKTTYDTSKSMKNSNTINFDPLKTKNSKIESAVIYPKNINEYVHLLKNHAFTQGDLDWTLELRDDKKNGKYQKKYHLIHQLFMKMILKILQEKQEFLLLQNLFYIMTILLN